MPSNSKNTLVISAGAILFSSLIGTALCITGAVLGGALGITLMPKLTSLSTTWMVLVGVLTSLALTMTFFVAGYIAARVAHQQFIFDSIIHSLSSWAIMAVVLVSLLVVVNLFEGVRRNLSGINAPALVTDVSVFKGKAVTSIDSVKKDSKTERAEERQEHRVDNLLALAWWITFSSLVLGACGAIIGGLIGRKKQRSNTVA